MNLDLSKASGPDCIPVVVLKNCEPELSYILAELFNKCLKESCFPDCWKVSSVVLVFKNVGERSTAKNYRPVSLLLYSQYGFRSSQSTADLLTGLGLLELWHLIYPRLLTGFGMLVCFTNLSLMESHVRYLSLFLLFSIIDKFEWFWMESLHKNIQLMWEFLKAPFLVLVFSYYTLMIFLTMLSVILLSMLMILLSVLSVIRHLICGNNLNWLLNLNLANRGTVDWCKKCLVDFNAGKTQLVLFDQSNNNGSIDVKMDGSVLEEKSSFKMLGLTFLSKLDWGSYIISTAKTASKKIGALSPELTDIF